MATRILTSRRSTTETVGARRSGAGNIPCCVFERQRLLEQVSSHDNRTITTRRHASENQAAQCPNHNCHHGISLSSARQKILYSSISHFSTLLTARYRFPTSRNPIDPALRRIPTPQSNLQTRCLPTMCDGFLQIATCQGCGREQYNWVVDRDNLCPQRCGKVRKTSASTTPFKRDYLCAMC